MRLALRWQALPRPLRAERFDHLASPCLKREVEIGRKAEGPGCRQRHVSRRGRQAPVPERRHAGVSAIRSEWARRRSHTACACGGARDAGGYLKHRHALGRDLRGGLALCGGPGPDHDRHSHQSLGRLASCPARSGAIAGLSAIHGLLCGHRAHPTGTVRNWIRWQTAYRARAHPAGADVCPRNSRVDEPSRRVLPHSSDCLDQHCCDAIDRERGIESI